MMKNKLKRIVKVAVILIVLSPICWVAAQLWKIHAYDTGYSKVAVGDSEAEVLAILGRPSEIKPCAQEDKDAGECAKVYWYNSPMPYVAPEMWVIRFNKDNQVASTYHYISP